jgi:hypothetical protein
MARLPGHGRDFDDRWNASYRRGRENARRGVGPWATDKALERVNAERATRKHAAASSDSCVAALAALGGFAWALSELAGRIIT